MIKALYQYRRYIISNSVNDLKNRYAGTRLGFLWNVIHPFTMVAVMSLVFSGIMPVRVKGNYSTEFSMALYLTSGLIPWLFFTEAVGRGSTALLESAHFLKKLPIPEEVFVAKATFTSLLSFLILLLILFTFSTVMGHFPDVSWLLLAPVALLLLTLVFGLGLFLACLNLFFRDLGQIVPVILQVLMWLAPILYTEEAAPRLLKTIAVVNPFAPFLSGFRSVLLYYTPPDPGLWAAMLAWAGAAVLLGIVTMRRVRKDLRDVL
ncbi:ABC transporter permease [Azospirillum thermophilum]|uniref:Transport permease protein n=1 Tax=Azospirillum thermophilum TaxID=2202148 RepID=A0A2S2D0H2_9PROT|nr:ABC transporter permease [Azospirillum thermophilum]AWK90195.1 hypothetical protein DEW08_29725 [Azospirillum thermophilum]